MNKTILTSEASGLTIKNGEALFVQHGSSLVGLVIESGGLLVVDPNAVIRDVTVKTGGRIMVGGFAEFVKDLKDDLPVAPLPPMHIEEISYR